MRSPKPVWLVNALLVCASLVAGIVVAEGFLRWAGLDHAILWAPDPRLGWRSIPNATGHWTEEGQAFVRMNSHGYRDRERETAKPKNTFRIAVFGDSMTQAVQVELEETFTHRLEERFRSQELAIEVLNFGVNGYSPVQELLLLKEEGPRFQPDLVILAAFLDNDVSGVSPKLGVVNQAGPPFVTANGAGLEFDFSRSQQSFEHYRRQPFYFLRRNSAVYRVLSEYRWRQAATVSMNTEQQSIPQRYFLYKADTAPVWEDAWRTFEQVILEFEAECRRQGLPLLLLSVPAPQVAADGAWQRIVAGIPAMSHIEWDLEGPERRLATFANAHGIQLVQPYKVFQSQNDLPPLFFGNVGHLTARGHEVMAEALAAVESLGPSGVDR
jgi:lysophospholipase L1-like esterase